MLGEIVVKVLEAPGAAEAGVPAEVEAALEIVSVVLAVRALLQQTVSAGYPIVAAVRADATPDQILDLYARLRLLLRESGLAATGAS